MTSRSAGSAGTRTRGGTSRPLHIELPDERRHQLRAVQVLDPIHHPAAAAEHPSPPHEEHLERGLQIVLREADHVEVLGLGEHHLLRLHRPARGGELVAELGGLLVLLALGRLPHLGVQPRDDGLRVAAQEVAQRVDVGPVGLLGDPGHRRARTARSTGRCRSRGTGAAPGRAESKNEFVQVRTGKTRVSASSVSRIAQAWPYGPKYRTFLRFVPRMTCARGHVSPTVSARYGIGLVVAVPDVEPGQVPLDQVVLEHQRVDLAGGERSTRRSAPPPSWPAVRACSGLPQ